MKIVVYKCPFTGKLFEQKDKAIYAKHLSELREKQRQDREYDRLRSTWCNWLAEERANIHYVEEIPAWFLKNQRKIMDAVNALKFSSGFDRCSKFVKDDKFVNLEWERCQFTTKASNTHVCPDDGITNWGSEKDKPAGYTGWVGYLKGSLVRPNRHNYSYPYSEALNIVGIKTGTGGGGNINFGYGFTIFLRDWPGLQHQVNEIEQDQIVHTLKGK